MCTIQRISLSIFFFTQSLVASEKASKYFVSEDLTDMCLSSIESYIFWQTQQPCDD